jgi:hypothetical protein
MIAQVLFKRLPGHIVCTLPQTTTHIHCVPTTYLYDITTHHHENQITVEKYHDKLS